MPAVDTNRPFDCWLVWTTPSIFHVMSGLLAVGTRLVKPNGCSAGRASVSDCVAGIGFWIVCAIALTVFTICSRHTAQLG